MSYCLHHDKRISCPKCKEDYIYEYKTMNNPPQSVTERYVSNLIHNGRNKEFDIKIITQYDAMIEEHIVGVYYRARLLPANVADNGANVRVGVGATLALAVRNALEQHGVTFR